MTYLKHSKARKQLEARASRRQRWLEQMEEQHKLSCPLCGAANTATILYGLLDLPADLLDRGIAVAGGCDMSEGMPEFECGKCGHSWGSLKLGRRSHEQPRSTAPPDTTWQRVVIKDTHELAQRLYFLGCRPDSYAIGLRASASDAFCLVRSGRQWNVFYTERGYDQSPLFSSEDESLACEFLLKQLMSFRHDRHVGDFQSVDKANELQQRLEDIGLRSTQRAYATHKTAGQRYLVSVDGVDFFTARAELGDIPIRD